MKHSTFFFLFTLILSAAAWATEPPHFDLEMTSQEYREKLSLPEALEGDKKLNPVQKSLRAGETLFNWIDLINAKRPDDQKIRLTSKDTRKGIPITSPKRYGPASIQRDLGSIQAELPQAMKEVLFNKKPPTADPLVEDKVFIEFGRRVDRLYQTASRWTLLKPYKGYYSSRRVQDVRGYYFLNENSWDENRLQAEWANLKDQRLERVKQGLTGICVNSGMDARSCRGRIDRMNNGSDAAKFYKRYISRARQVWNGFFEIKNARRDIDWKEPKGLPATTAHIPFFDPKADDVRSFIKDNIEDEFRWEDWGLKINFVKRKPSPYVVFVPGATPNVNGLGGNKITMDGNKPIDEYEVQWIIRHEFGHVLGIPDCYHEFYDIEKDEFVNYQIDTTDLMCSRAGNMNERIYLQLRNKYAQSN